VTKRRVEGGTTEATQPRRLQRTASPKGIVCPRQRHERGGEREEDTDSMQKHSQSEVWSRARLAGSWHGCRASRPRHILHQML